MYTWKTKQCQDFLTSPFSHTSKSILHTKVVLGHLSRGLDLTGAGGGVGPASASGSLSPFRPRAVYKDLVLLLQKDHCSQLPS